MKKIIDWLKEYWRAIIFVPIITVVVIYGFLKLDDSEGWKTFCSFVGYFSIVGFLVKFFKEERQRNIDKARREEEHKEIKKKYFE